MIENPNESSEKMDDFAKKWNVDHGSVMGHGQKIRELARIKYGVDRGAQQRLAEDAHIKQTTLSNLIARVPDNVTAALRVAKTLGVPAEWLFDDQTGMGDIPVPSTEDTRELVCSAIVSLSVLAQRIRKEELKAFQAMIEKALGPDGDGGQGTATR